MQLVLGVAVADSVAHLALVDTTSSEAALDQFDVALAGGATEALVRTISDTSRSLSADGYRLSGINIVATDPARGEELRGELARAGVGDVTVVPAADAATAYVRNAAGSAGQQTSALILVDGDTAALSVVGADASTTSLVDAESVAPEGPDTACTAMVERLRDETGGAQTLYLVSASADAAALTERLRAQSPIPLHAPADPHYLLALGAAAASLGPSVDAAAQTMAAPAYTAPGPVIGEHLAYSMAEDSGSIPIGVAQEYDETPLQTPMTPLSSASAAAPHTDDPDEFEEPAPAAAGRPRVLLLGSTVAASVVVGFAVLAVGVAINIKPTVSQQPVRDYEAVPGKSLPTMPGQSYEAVEDMAAYLPPVVPVPVEEQIAGGPTWYPTRSSGGGDRGASYSQSSAGSGGGLPTIGGGGGGPIGTPVGGGGVANPLGGFRLADWFPDLPDNLVINFPDFQPSNVCDNDCQDAIFEATRCLPGRPGFVECIKGSSAVSVQKPTDTDEPATTGDPVETLDSEDNPAVDQRLGTESGSEDGSDAVVEGGTPDEVVVTDGDDQKQQPAPDSPETPADGEAPADSESPDRDPAEPGPEGSSPPPPGDPKAPEATPPVADTERSQDKPASDSVEPEAPSDSKPEPAVDSDPAPKPAPPAPKPAPPAPKPAPPAPEPEPVVEAPAPPPPPKPAPPVVVEAPAPPPPPVVVEAPAPPPPPPVVEAPAPVVIPELPFELPFELPSFGGGSGSSSGSDSGSSSSDESPVTTEVESP